MTVDIQANNLILKSVQDIISEKIRGANLHIGFDLGHNITGFGGGIEPGFKDKAWTNQIGKIIGSQIVNIIVKETLEIASGLITNAEENQYGEFTEKGILSVNAARMIVKNIHDYDDGLTLGIGASFQLNQVAKNTIETSFNHAPIKIEYKDHKRQVLSTVSSGLVTSDLITCDELNRNISNQIQVSKKAEASFDSVVHKDMFENIIVDKKSPIIKQLKTHETDLTLNERFAYYLCDTVENFKQALRDGVDIANILGHNFQQNSDSFEERETQYHINKEGFEKKLDNITDENVRKNIAHYLAYIDNLEKQLSNTNNQNEKKLQRFIYIYKGECITLFEKFEKNISDLPKFDVFYKDMNRKHVYSNPSFATQIHKFIVNANNSNEETSTEIIKYSEIRKIHAEEQRQFEEEKLAYEEQLKILKLKAKQLQIDTKIKERKLEEEKIPKKLVPTSHEIFDNNETMELSISDLTLVPFNQKPQNILTQKDAEHWSEFIEKSEEVDYSFSLINSAEASGFNSFAPISILQELPLLETGLLASGKFILKHGKYVAKKLPFVGTAVGAAYLYNSNDYSFKNIVYNLLPGADIAMDAYENFTKSESHEEAKLIPVWNVNHAIQLKGHVNNEFNYEFALPNIFGYYDIDPDASKPKIISTPIPPKIDDLESFPIHDDDFKLPGFEIVQISFGNSIESFPIHEYEFGDFILTMSSKLSEEEQVKHKETVKDIVTALHGKDVSDELVKKLEQKTSKYYDSKKIIGKAQSTDKEGNHKTAIEIETIVALEEEDTVGVIRDQGVKKYLGAMDGKNIRPDVIVVKKDGKVKLIEVVSKSQTVGEMDEKLDAFDEIIKKKYPDKIFEYKVAIPEEIFIKYRDITNKFLKK